MPAEIKPHSPDLNESLLSSGSADRGEKQKEDRKLHEAPNPNLHLSR
jgi:hypothetical protein